MIMVIIEITLNPVSSTVQPNWGENLAKNANIEKYGMSNITYV